MQHNLAHLQCKFMLYVAVALVFSLVTFQFDDFEVIDFLAVDGKTE